MRKTITALAIGALILGGAAVAYAQTDDSSDDGEIATVHPLRAKGALLHDVLDDLVADGTIDQSQADAIVAALGAKQDEMIAQRDRLRDQLESFWDDDVLTVDEIAQLPEWHPLRQTDGPLSEYLADGRLTRDELREARSELRPGRRHRGPGRGGLGLFRASAQTSPFLSSESECLPR